jgi:hypothetical protein
MIINIQNVRMHVDPYGRAASNITVHSTYTCSRIHMLIQILARCMHVDNYPML